MLLYPATPFDRNMKRQQVLVLKNRRKKVSGAVSHLRSSIDEVADESNVTTS
jgi:hypothetical protein